MDEFRMLLEVNQSRIEKKIFDLKRSQHTQCEQGDNNSRCKNLAKLLLLVVKMKNSLLREAKFDNHINSIKPLISELDDPEIENAVDELENLKEINTLHELKLSFEKLLILSITTKVDDRNDPLRVKFAEIEESINDNDWQNITVTVSNLTHSEFKPWLNKLNGFIVIDLDNIENAQKLVKSLSEESDRLSLIKLFNSEYCSSSINDKMLSIPFQIEQGILKEDWINAILRLKEAVKSNIFLPFDHKEMFAVFYCALAKQYESKGNFKEAIKSLFSYSAIFQPINYLKAELYIKHGKIRKASAVLEAEYTVNPTPQSAKMYINLNSKGAERLYNLRPDYYFSYCLLALSSMSSGKYDLASQYLDTAMKKANYMSIYFIVIQLKVTLQEHDKGFVLGCYVGAASENDRGGVKMALDNMKEKYSNIKKMWADMGYQGKDLKDYVKREYGIDIEIVKRPPCRFWVHKDTPLELLPQRHPGFSVQPRRVVYKMKSLKELSLRIKNIKSVQKTTKIMQMVSAAKLLESQKKLLNSKLYVSKLHNIISSLMLSVDQELLAKILNVSNDGSYLVFIVASDRGLCGNFNSSIVKFSQERVNKSIANGKKVDILFLGKKAFDVGKNRFDSKSILKIENSKEITLKHVEALVDGIDLSKYDKVKVFYSKFYNTFMQKPMLETIKPWSKDSSLIDSSLAGPTTDYDYEYEPQNIEFILKSLVQDNVVIALYSALLESATSENSARMVAMESANRNTKEILNKLALL
uniref:F-ATPase gamma subunit n=1 Tax=Glossina morsitans morsitans TaxID=37546 RepID=A0A1B0FE29_GLOMM